MRDPGKKYRIILTLSVIAAVLLMVWMGFLVAGREGESEETEMKVTSTSITDGKWKTVCAADRNPNRPRG